MPEDAEPQPVRRGPGRPRRVPAPHVDTPASESEHTDESDHDDPRIGQSCDLSWSGVGYDDGTTYRCKDGKIVERVY